MTVKRYDRPRRPRTVIADDFADLPTWLAARLLDWTHDEMPPAISEWELFLAAVADRETLRAGWAKHGTAITARWIDRHPGTRPALWWTFDAPEPERLRLGGHGTPSADVLAEARTLVRGLPAHWIDAYWMGVFRADGEPHRAQKFDPTNPPRFESQAAYLRRHALLFRGEAGRLSVEDFAPEVLPRRCWPDDTNDGVTRH